jgi:hypothetical protein
LAFGEPCQPDYNTVLKADCIPETIRGIDNPGEIGLLDFLLKTALPL